MESLNASVSVRQFCESLYCAMTPIDAFSAAASGNIHFIARLTANGRESVHSVEFNGVRDFTRQRDTECEPEAGDRLELSVVELERGGSGWKVWFNPWYVEEIEFRCERIFLDAIEVTESGRSLQDSLPEAAAKSETRSPLDPSSA